MGDILYFPYQEKKPIGIREDIRVGKGFDPDHAFAATTQVLLLNSETRAVTLALASPNNMRVFYLKKSGLSMPAKPEVMLRLSTKTVLAWSTLMICMP